MTVYAVFKEGIYRHECAGVFSVLERAKQVAAECLERGDGHHSFEVVPFEVDAPTVFARDTLDPELDDYDRRMHGDDIRDPDSVYKVTKPKAPW